MAKLHRPYIPIEVRCTVVLRQLGEMWPGRVIDTYRHIASNKMPPRSGLGTLLAKKLKELAQLLGCEVTDLRLDHDPALCNRRWNPRLREYDIPANDPEHLIYRSKLAHDIKTRVRGDGAQFSDLALLRREKKRRKKSTTPLVKSRNRRDKPAWPTRPFPKRGKPWPDSRRD